MAMKPIRATLPISVVRPLLRPDRTESKPVVVPINRGDRGDSDRVNDRSHRDR